MIVEIYYKSLAILMIEKHGHHPTLALEVGMSN